MPNAKFRMPNVFSPTLRCSLETNCSKCLTAESEQLAGTTKRGIQNIAIEYNRIAYGLLCPRALPCDCDCQRIPKELLQHVCVPEAEHGFPVTAGIALQQKRASCSTCTCNNETNTNNTASCNAFVHVSTTNNICECVPSTHKATCQRRISKIHSKPVSSRTKSSPYSSKQFGCGMNALKSCEAACKNIPIVRTN